MKEDQLDIEAARRALAESKGPRSAYTKKERAMIHLLVIRGTKHTGRHLFAACNRYVNVRADAPWLAGRLPARLTRYGAKVTCKACRLQWKYQGSPREVETGWPMGLTQEEWRKQQNAARRP